MAWLTPRSMRTDVALRGAIVVAACLSVFACASSQDEEPDLPAADQTARDVARRKQKLLLAADQAIQHLVGQAIAEVAAIRGEADQEFDALPVSIELGVVDDELERVGEAQRARFEAAVTDLEERTVAALEEVLTRTEDQMWEVAIGAGETERGGDLGYRSGFRELDEKVQAAAGQLGRIAGVDGVQQLAIMRRAARVTVQRKIREEIEGLGVLQIFVSPPTEQTRLLGLPTYRSPDGFPRIVETVVQVSSFRSEEGDALAQPLQFIEAVRTRLERGGVMVQGTPWRWAPGTEGGVKPTHSEVNHEGYLAGVETMPMPEPTSLGFEAMRSHTLVREYRTGLQRSDTGELVAQVAWQVVWRVDYRGQLRVSVERSLERIVDDDVLATLLEAEADAGAEEESRVGGAVGG